MRRIETWSPDGELLSWWGESGTAVEAFSGCCNPVNIAILPDGHFITVEKGILRVKEYDEYGTFIGVVAGPEQLLDDPEDMKANSAVFDVAVDEQGWVYILDTLKNKVRVFRKKEQ
jgi:hypothetical protein